MALKLSLLLQLKTAFIAAVVFKMAAVMLRCVVVGGEGVGVALVGFRVVVEYVGGVVFADVGGCLGVLVVVGVALLPW